MRYNDEQPALMVSEQQHKVISMTAPISTDKQDSKFEDFENQFTDVLETFEQNSEKSPTCIPSGGVFKKPVAKA